MCNRRRERHPNYFISMKRRGKPYRISLLLQRKITLTARKIAGSLEALARGAGLILNWSN
jgi:hypothetical protein